MSDTALRYKDTLTITKTDFPQKARLPESEPKRLARWKAIGLAHLIEQKSEGRPKYVLHDGPPYANGDIHLGHAFNKTLKDIVVRYKTMNGFAARYVPGFDCHGLPIEQKVFDKLGRDAATRDPVEVRRLCHEYATRYIGLQSEQFQRLGVGGVWDAPYRTLDPKYEVGILKAFAVMVRRGYIYKGFKPVYWDTRFRTALAEAEIEYEERTSPSIYVRFPILNPEDCPQLKDYASAAEDGCATHAGSAGSRAAKAGDGAGANARGINIVIWTTTPWTLPGNLAVAVHPEFHYVLIDVGGERIVCAEGLLHAFAADARLPEPRILTRFRGAALENLKCAHPLLDKESLVILADHVTLEQGTGCVHTAPGHGVEDFDVCKKHGIEVFQPVDETGRYSHLYPDMEGELVWDANPKVLERLKEKGLLVHAGEVAHQYPHSWRSHEPVVIRATDQWFMSIDHEDLRQRCLRAINEDVQWFPAWGRERIANMMETRPDWCLSRQRAWGVPIPSLYSVEAKQSILCAEIVERFAERVAEHGTDCWFTMPVETFIPEGFKCPVSGGTKFEKECDILDVWFDSGASHIAVLEQDEGLEWPADLYLEGNDQYRGWFMSSLTVAMAARDAAPYKAVLTNGWVLDGEGRPMSKSLGNVISPLDVIARMGADVLRLWIVSEDYRSDVRASEEIFQQIMDAYRRIRNTLRFLLGNLTDFDPEEDAVPPEERTELDRWALGALAQLLDRVTRAYETFEFHKIYHAVNQYCVVTMSALYLDILKDRLYCSAPDDKVRRSAQSTIWDVFSVLTRALAPILPFTADEAYAYAKPRKESIHLEDFPSVPDGWRDAALAEKWERFLAIRDAVNPPMEAARREKTIGKSLDAAVVLRPKSTELAAFLHENVEILRDVLIVSQCSVDASLADREKTDALEEALDVHVSKAGGEKCARCWTYSESVGADCEHPSLCRRCSGVLRRLS